MGRNPRHGLALAAVLAALLLGVAAYGDDESSGQTSSRQVIKVYSLTLRGKEQPVHVVATGRISGTGTLTQQTDRESRSGDVHHVTLRFDRGIVRVALRLTPQGEGWSRVNRRTCTAKRFGRGTFIIDGGTGAYDGAAGQGRFEQGGIAIAQRTSSGKCLGERTPPTRVVFYVKLRMAGEAVLPSS
jgi:hypothetical protein